MKLKLKRTNYEAVNSIDGIFTHGKQMMDDTSLATAAEGQELLQQADEHFKRMFHALGFVRHSLSFRTCA